MKPLRGLLLATVLVLAGCQSTPPQGDAPDRLLPQPQEIAAAGDYVHAPSTLTFPPGVGRFQRTEIKRFDAAGLNVGISYRLQAPSDEVLATAYVYPGPWITIKRVSVADLPRLSKLDHAGFCKAEFEGAKTAIKTLHPSARLTFEGSTIVDQYFSRAMAEYEYSGDRDGRQGDLSTRLYLFCLGKSGWLVKFRVTAPKGVDWEDILSPFTNELARRWDLQRLPPVPMDGPVTSS
ncbi:hypothetical protein KXS07_14075 [Inquilinus limosus]|uniref:hypothetical protein n=1 Tax=Inquilinus limosus TaxID=171674 RepID=UPI003F180D44